MIPQNGNHDDSHRFEWEKLCSHFERSIESRLVVNRSRLLPPTNSFNYRGWPWKRSVQSAWSGNGWIQVNLMEVGQQGSGGGNGSAAKGTVCDSSSLLPLRSDNEQWTVCTNIECVQCVCNIMAKLSKWNSNTPTWKESKERRQRRRWRTKKPWRIVLWHHMMLFVVEHFPFWEIFLNKDTFSKFWMLRFRFKKLKNSWV